MPPVVSVFSTLLYFANLDCQVVIRTTIRYNYHMANPLNIYFSFSITGGREFQPIMKAMAEVMLAEGCIVPTAMNTRGDIDPIEWNRDPIEIYQRDIQWIDECDIVIAEVSTPSHGVGYEIAYALATGKPVYCFHRSDVRISKMISGNPHEKLAIYDYDNGEELRTNVHHLIVYCRQD